MTDPTETNDRPSLTVRELLEVATPLPLTAGVLLEDQYGRKYEVAHAYTIGTKTDDPGLIIKIRNLLP